MSLTVTTRTSSWAKSSADLHARKCQITRLIPGQDHGRGARRRSPNMFGLLTDIRSSPRAGLHSPCSSHTTAGSRMSRVSEVLGFLRGNTGYVSGDYISSRLGLSRTAVWKYVGQLKKDGYGHRQTEGQRLRLLSRRIASFLGSGTIPFRQTFIGRRTIEYRIHSTPPISSRTAGLEGGLKVRV